MDSDKPGEAAPNNVQQSKMSEADLSRFPGIPCVGVLAHSRPYWAFVGRHEAEKAGWATYTKEEHERRKQYVLDDPRLTTKRPQPMALPNSTRKRNPHGLLRHSGTPLTPWRKLVSSLRALFG